MGVFDFFKKSSEPIPVEEVSSIKQHSEMYTKFINIINGTGYNRLGGIPKHLLNEVYDWEREEVENIVWNRFLNNDMDMTFYLPHLTFFQPTETVKNKLGEYKIPSRQSVQLSYTMYKLTKEQDYLNIVKNNIEKKTESTSYIALVLQDFEKNDENIYNLLRELYVNVADLEELCLIEDGLFFCKGIISSLFAVQTDEEINDLSRKYFSEDIEERKNLIDEFEKEFG